MLRRIGLFEKSFCICLCLFAAPVKLAWSEPAPNVPKASSKKDTIQAKDMSAATILQRCDEVRNPAGSYQMEVTVINHDGSSSRFQVFTQGVTSTLIKTTAPKRDIGRDLLMLGDQMWAYIPNLKRSVRVSLNQRLSGQAANGDIARMRWADDYKAEIVEQTPAYWLLHLKAKRQGLTYDGLQVWVEKTSFRPIKAHYLALSGKLLKRSRFEKFKNLAGRMRPSQMTIEDAHDSERHSTIVIEAMKKADFPSIWFQPSQLGQ